ncbi:hypothetical protein RIR_jg37308.t1 [Rhizophagus irregularis DAOM 181602=DAOM 197198]|nr:hypothetical protein RIR_jg37308.t1 [Rhizophagus irregularis DAOM 181602=DAOM 197198]
MFAFSSRSLSSRFSSLDPIFNKFKHWRADLGHISRSEGTDNKGVLKTMQVKLRFRLNSKNLVAFDVHIDQEEDLLAQNFELVFVVQNHILTGLWSQF